MKVLSFLFFVLLLACSNGTKKECLSYDLKGKLIKVSRADHIIVDGSDADWYNSGTEVLLFADPLAVVPNKNDLNSSFKVGWSPTALNVFVKVKDDSIFSAENVKKNGDGIELFLADRRGGKNILQYIIVPDFSKEPAEMRIVNWDHRGSRNVAGKDMTITSVAIKTKEGYCIEASIPFSFIDVKPFTGLELAMEVVVHDYDGVDDTKANTLNWNNLKDTYRNNYALKRVILTDEKTEPIAVDVKSYIKDRDTVYFFIYGKIDLVGKQVVIKDSIRQYFSGILKNNDEYASLNFSMPINDSITMPIGVFVDGEFAEAIDLSIANYKLVNKIAIAFEEDIRLLKMKDKYAVIPNNPILFIGHSMFRYWHCFEEDMKGYDAINRAFGGSRTENIIQYYNDVVKPYNPRAIVYFEGANDFHSGVPVEKYIENVKKFLEMVHADFPSIKVFTLSPDIRDEHPEFNTELKKLIANYTFVEYINLEGLKKKMGIPAYQKILLPDNTHWNSDGYLILAPIIQAHLKEYKN